MKNKPGRKKTNKKIQQQNRRAENTIKRICSELGITGFINEANNDKSLRISGIPSTRTRKPKCYR